MFLFKNLKQRNSFNNKYNKVDSSYFNFIDKVNFHITKGVKMDSMGRRYMFKDEDDEDNNEYNYENQNQIIQSQYSNPFNKNKIIEEKEQINKKNILENYTNFNEEISNMILKEQHKINTMELNEIYRLQKHNQIMGSLMNENMKKKQILKELELENKNNQLNDSSKKIKYVILPKKYYKKNILNELKNKNKKLSESLELIKINHSQSMNLLYKKLDKVIEENERIKNEKNKLRFEIDSLRNEIYKIKENINDISLPILRTSRFINQNDTYQKINNDDENWLKKILKRDNYLLKKFEQMN